MTSQWKWKLCILKTHLLLAAAQVCSEAMPLDFICRIVLNTTIIRQPVHRGDSVRASSLPSLMSSISSNKRGQFQVPLKAASPPLLQMWAAFLNDEGKIKHPSAKSDPDLSSKKFTVFGTRLHRLPWIWYKQGTEWLSKENLH